MRHAYLKRGKAKNSLVNAIAGSFVGRCALIATAVLCSAVLVVAVRAYNSRTAISDDVEREPSTAPVQPSPAPHTGQSSPAPARVEVQVITVRPRGFEPSNITRPAGIFLLAVDNRSGLDELLLRLDREAGNRVHEQRVPRKKLDWRGAFDLTPGHYVLTEANNPDWVCHITITAH
jgi:hypothetical protein